MSFDFEAAVVAPFRMQPGLRRLAPGRRQFTPMAAGSRHQREKLAVLSCHAQQALLAREGFNAQPALQGLFSEVQLQQPASWAFDVATGHVLAHHLGAAVRADGTVQQLSTGSFGLGDEVARCLHLLPPPWRQVGLLCLAFEEDFAIIDSSDGSIPWLAVALPSHWAPETKVGRHFADVHAPVADNQLLLKAGASLMRLVCSPERWERFVWTVTDHPRLHAHPDRTDPDRWRHTDVSQAWWRTEHQTFIPLPHLQQAIFTIHVQVQPLAEALRPAGRAQALHEAVASMSSDVLAYRGLDRVQAPLLRWLAAQGGHEAS